MTQSGDRLCDSIIDRKCGQSSSNKLSIVKERLTEEDLDRLVIDTSNLIARRGLTEFPSRSNGPIEKLSDEPQSTSATQQQQPSAIIAGSHNQLSQPKRPMNAFMVWGQAIRRDFHDRFSNVQNALLSKALGRVWRSLVPSEKEPFIRRASVIKANHKRDYPDYRYQPRRIQAKRRKCGMPIGITLNDTVGHHHLEQTSFAQAATNFGSANSNFYLQASSRDHQQAAHETAKHRDSSIRADRYDCRRASAEHQHVHLYQQIRQREILRLQIDGVQAYEHQPYQAAQTLPNSNFGCRAEDGFSHELRYQHLAVGSSKQQISAELAVTNPPPSYHDYQHQPNHSILNETSPAQFQQAQHYECPYEISLSQPVNMTSNNGHYQSTASLSNYDTCGRQYIL